MATQPNAESSYAGGAKGFGKDGKFVLPPRVATALAGIFTVFVAASCTAGTETASPADPNGSATQTGALTKLSGQLFFTHTTSGDIQTVLVADADGQRQLTQPGEVCCVLRKSPTDARILTLPSSAFTSPLTGVTMNLDGQDVVPIPRTDPTLNMVPSAWSPDGLRIAFVGWDDGDATRTGVYTARSSDGGDLVRVTERPGRLLDEPLDYSPDGTQIVYYRSAHPDPSSYTDGSLWVVNVDGSGDHQIASQTTPTAWARWSPDGRRILFAAERLAAAGPIWTVAPDDTELTTVYQDDGGDFAIAPDWSPDGTQIVFALDPTNDEFTHPPNRVYAIGADGQNLQLVNDSNDFKRQLEWID